MVSLHFRGLTDRFIVAVGFFVLIAFVGPGLLAAGELTKWTNIKGREIEAELVGYDSAAKTVQLRKQGGPTGSVPLADLDISSKFLALTQPPVARVAYSRLQEKGWLGYALATGWSGLLMAIWLVVLAVGSLFVALLPFKLSVRILATNDRDLTAVLKLTAVSVTLEGVTVLATVGSTFFSAQEEFGRNIVVFSIAMSILYFLLATAIIERHYVVSWFRAIGIQLLFILIIAIATPFLAIAALIPLGMTFAGLLFSIDSLILKPLELI